LNPVAAGIAEVPEASAHTSIKQRGEHAVAERLGVHYLANLGGCAAR
jgi:hypothetical protein